MNASVLSEKKPPLGIYVVPHDSMAFFLQKNPLIRILFSERDSLHCEADGQQVSSGLLLTFLPSKSSSRIRSRLTHKHIEIHVTSCYGPNDPMQRAVNFPLVCKYLAAVPTTSPSQITVYISGQQALSALLPALLIWFKMV